MRAHERRAAAEHEAQRCGIERGKCANRPDYVQILRNERISWKAEMCLHLVDGFGVNVQGEAPCCPGAACAKNGP